jgi:hypothetical protein
MNLKSRSKGLLGCLICFGMIGAIPFYAQGAASPVVWQDSKLSVQFENVTISQILISISGVTGFKLTVDPAVGSYRESVSFKGLSLRAGILKVLEGSGIDFIVVGKPSSQQEVSQVLLLGYSPKTPVVPAGSNTPVAMGGLPGRPNPFASGAPATAFAAQPVAEQTATPQVDPGGFLPFPEASDNSEVANPQPDPTQKPVAPNPFNPNPSASPAPQTTPPSTPTPDRRAPAVVPPGRR